jgi:hypothetical protein
VAKSRFRNSLLSFRQRWLRQVDEGMRPTEASRANSVWKSLKAHRIFRLKSTYTSFVALVDISLQFPVVLWI